MKRRPIDRIVGLAILVGALMKLFDAPYGMLIFTVSFGAFLLLKFFRMFELNIRYWIGLHYLQLTFLLIAMAALILRYFEYPYSFAVFAVALLAELLISAKIKINQYVSDDALKNVFRFLRSRRNA